MIDVEREIRDAFRRHDDDVPVVVDETPSVVRRVRRRQLANAIGATVFAVALGLAALAGLDALERADRRPANPDRTPAVTDRSGVTGATSETGHEIYAIDVATGEAEFLWHAPTKLSDPERSPDGTSLIYARKGGGDGSQIFLVGPDGIERQLTSFAGGAKSPTWSPDGTRIAFAGAQASGVPDIYVMNADGSDQRLVADAGSGDQHPGWSPDGERIVFLGGAGSGDTGGVWIVTLADGALSHITDASDADGDRAPAWSPAGDWIVFLRFEDAPGGNLEADETDIYLVRPDGTEVHRLLDAEGPLEVPPGGEDGGFTSSTTPDGHRQDAPAWSPDGSKLAWGDIHYGVRVADVETQEIRILTSTFWYDLSWDEAGLVGVEF